jgi:hypothetical protein
LGVVAKNHHEIPGLKPKRKKKKKKRKEDAIKRGSRTKELQA